MRTTHSYIFHQLISLLLLGFNFFLISSSDDFNDSAISKIKIHNYCNVHSHCDTIRSDIHHPNSMHKSDRIHHRPCSTHHQSSIVDVFYLAAYPKNYTYIKEGQFWNGPLLVQALSRCNDTRVHIFSEDAAILSKSLQYGFISHNISKYSNIEQSFRRMYRHVSFNYFDYEFLCFYRWHMFNQMIKTWNTLQSSSGRISRVITLDTDVLLMMNAAEFYKRAVVASGVDKSNMDLIIASPGAVQLWSSHGIRKFSDFIYDWYNETTSIVMERSLNASALFAKSFKVFSDMEMVSEFALRNTAKRKPCLSIVSQTKSADRKPWQDCVIESLGCVPVGDYGGILGSRYIFDPHRPISWSSELFGFKDDKEKYPFCYLHFQGDRTKYYLRFYGNYMLQMRVGNWTEFGPMLVTTSTNPNEVFLVDRAGYLRGFWNYEAFVKLNYNAWMIYRKLPAEMVDSLPKGPPITVNDTDLMFIMTKDYIFAHGRPSMGVKQKQPKQVNKNMLSPGMLGRNPRIKIPKHHNSKKSGKDH